MRGKEAPARGRGVGKGEGPLAKEDQGIGIQKKALLPPHGPKDAREESAR